MSQRQVKRIRAKVRQVKMKQALAIIKEIQELPFRQRWWFARKILFKGKLTA